MRIVLMGPPGAGKGTQADRLAKAFHMDHLSSGDIFRAERASGSPLGAELAGYMDAGKLVPDETVVKVMAKAIAASTAPGGLLLDGFPRTVPQAEALDEQLRELGKPLDAVVVITADDNEVVARITGRRSCPMCGRIYHMKFMPPRKDEVCDADGAKLTQRPDDRETVVRERLKAYDRQTEPVIGYYRDRAAAPVVEVNGNGPPDAVTEEMQKVVGDLSVR